MSTYVLVHGAWHGGWCWDKVVPFLESAGHKVSALDLPSHGQDKTPPGEVTLQSYTDKVCQVIDEQAEPVILVGHSMGGLVLSQSGEQRPDKIKTLVYLTAFMINNGESLLEWASRDTLSKVPPNMTPNETEGVLVFNLDKVKEAFYADCSDEDIAWAKTLLVNQPIAPFVTPIAISEENFGRVPRVYIECTQDQAIPLYMQQAFINNKPCQKVFTMEASHSPFFSAPEELANHLLAI